MPFISETMLRSGEPPHIGQSPVPESEANESQIQTKRHAVENKIVRFIGLASL